MNEDGHQLLRGAVVQVSFEASSLRVLGMGLGLGLGHHAARHREFVVSALDGCDLVHQRPRQCRVGRQHARVPRELVDEATISSRKKEWGGRATVSSPPVGGVR